jgi:hypothetical protein
MNAKRPIASASYGPRGRRKLGGFTMGLFDLFKSKDKSQQTLMDGISSNATRIQNIEGKSRDESEYLAICSLIDEIRKPPLDQDRFEALMTIVEKDYPQLVNELIAYVGWSSGQVKLEPQADQAMRKRHGKSTSH